MAAGLLFSEIKRYTGGPGSGLSVAAAIDRIR